VVEASDVIAAHTVHIGIDLVASFVLVAILFGTVYDLVLARRDDSLGRQLANWAHRYPLFAGALIAVLGATLGHFFTQQP
jgi:hypothetical protein